MPCGVAARLSILQKSIFKKKSPAEAGLNRRAKIVGIVEIPTVY